MAFLCGKGNEKSEISSEVVSHGLIAIVYSSRWSIISGTHLKQLSGTHMFVYEMDAIQGKRFDFLLICDIVADYLPDTKEGEGVGFSYEGAVDGHFLNGREIDRREIRI